MVSRRILVVQKQIAEIYILHRIIFKFLIWNTELKMTRTISLLTIATLLFTFSMTSCADKGERESIHFQKAKQFVSEKKYQEAVLELKNVIKLAPDNDQAQVLLGDIYIEMGEVLLSARAYSAALKQNPENMRAHLKLGQMMLLTQNTLKARVIAKAILKKEPDSLDAFLLLAEVQVQENNLAGAIDTVQEAIALHPEEIRPRLLLGLYQEIKGDPGAVEKTYLNAIDVSPSSPESYIRLLRFYVTNGQGEEASHLFEVMHDRVEKYDSDLIGLAEICEGLKMAEIAEKIFRYAVSTAPAGNTIPLLQMGRYYARNGDSDRAISAMQQALKIDPKGLDVLVNIADVHLSSGNNAEAESEISEALGIDPDHVGANYIKAVLAFNEKNYVNASDRLDFVIKKNPDHAMAYYYKALCLLQNDASSSTETNLIRAASGYSDDAEAWAKKQAEENLLKAVSLQPNLQRAKLVLAKIYLDDRRIEKARLQIEDILENDPELDQALVLKCTLKLLEEDFHSAEATCKKALKNNPDSSAWLVRLGFVYAAMKQPDQVKIACQKALDLNPMQFDALEMMLNLTVADKRFDEALALCEGHIEKVSGYSAAEAIVENMAGNVYLAQGNRESAIRKFEQAIEKAPRYILPRMGIVRLCASEGRYEDAVSGLEAVLSINEEYLPARLILGDIYYGRGELKQAENYYRGILKIDPGHGRAANNLAFVLSRYDNRLPEALSLARTAVKKLPEDPAVRDTLGWIHYRLGNTYQARSELEESLSLNPNDALANYHMGLLCYENREYDKAREFVEKALTLDPDFENAANAKSLLDY